MCHRTVGHPPGGPGRPVTANPARARDPRGYRARIQPRRHADQSVTDARRRPLLGGQPSMRGRSRMRDGRLRIAEIRGNRQQARVIDHMPCARLPADHLKRQDSAVRGLLTARQVVLRVGLQTRVMHPLDRGV